MRGPATNLLLVLLATTAASAFKSTPAVKTICHPGGNVPLSLAVFGPRAFLAFCRARNETMSLGWRWTDSCSPEIRPFPSLQRQNATDCDAIQAVADLKVDRLGRLWALDAGLRASCPPKLWLFRVESENCPPSSHQLPFTAENALELVVDEAPDDWFAYVSDGTGRILVFGLQSNESRLVPVGSNATHLALSSNSLFFCASQCREIFSVSLRELRDPQSRVMVERLGNKSASLGRILVDETEVVYFHDQVQNSISTWDAKSQHQEIFYMLGENSNSSVFTVDPSNELWLLSQKKGNEFISKSSEYRFPDARTVAITATVVVVAALVVGHLVVLLTTAFLAARSKNESHSQQLMAVVMRSCFKPVEDGERETQQSIVTEDSLADTVTA